MMEGHGDDLYSFPGGIRDNFSSNAWWAGPPGELISYIKENIGPSMSHYPEPDAGGFKRGLASFYERDPSQFMVTAGAAEGIHLIPRLFPGGRALILTPTFSEYEDACQASNLAVDFFSWQGYGKNKDQFISERERSPLPPDEWFSSLMDQLRRGSYDLLFLCNPNNPGGEYLDIHRLRELQNLPDGPVLVVDEAYGDFYPEMESLLSQKGPLLRTIVIRSLTKVFSIPGLRLGYLVGDPSLITRIHRFRHPWSLSGPALLAGEWILKKKYESPFDPAGSLTESRWLFQEIGKIPGMDPRISSTHYFLIGLTGTTAPRLKRELGEKHGILIRDASNFRDLDESWIRLSARDRDGNTRLLAALQNFFQNLPEGE